MTNRFLKKLPIVIISITLLSFLQACAKKETVTIVKLVMIERQKLERPIKPDMEQFKLNIFQPNNNFAIANRLLCYSLDQYQKYSAWLSQIEKYLSLSDAVLNSYELEVDDHNSLVKEYKEKQDLSGGNSN